MRTVRCSALSETLEEPQTLEVTERLRIETGNLYLQSHITAQEIPHQRQINSAPQWQVLSTMGSFTITWTQPVWTWSARKCSAGGRMPKLDPEPRCTLL
jgi:hypothetical protein